MWEDATEYFRPNASGGTLGVALNAWRQKLEDDLPDVIRGLELGPDDYMTKPFSYKDRLARMRSAVLRARRATGRGL